MIQFNKIPAELKELNQWVIWKAIQKKGQKKPAKIPYQINGQEAKTNTPNTWNSFTKTKNAFCNGNGKCYNGVGFVFSENDPYVGIDFDNCIDENGNIFSTVLNWIKKFGSYAEYSQSGTGIHIICRGVKPGPRKQKNGIEIYDKLRYFVFTGNTIENYNTIKECQKELNQFYETVFHEELELEKRSYQTCSKTLKNAPKNEQTDFYYEILNILKENCSGLFNDYEEAFLPFIMGCKSAGIPYEDIDGILQQSNGYNQVNNAKIYEKLIPKKINFGTVYHFTEKATGYKLKEILAEKRKRGQGNRDKKRSYKEEDVPEIEWGNMEVFDNPPGTEKVKIENTETIHTVTTKKKKPSKAEIYFKVKETLKKWYDFKFNTITQKTEYSHKDKDSWKEIDDGFSAMCYFKLIENELYWSKADLDNLLVDPNFATPYDPLLDYFNNLPEWDRKTDYIKQYTDNIILIDESKREKLELEFKKWIVGTLTGIYSKEWCNHHIYTLVGGQGKGKSFYLNKLIPEKLKLYLQIGIDFENKDSKQQMASKFLINIDELEGYSKKDQDNLKTSITTKEFDVRVPYGRYTVKYKKRCSFMGSTNKMNFLPDPTGSRRFLIQYVKEIYYQNKINIDGIYSQAKYLYKNGFQYYFSGKEVENIINENEEFSSDSMEEQLLLTYYSPGEDLYYTTTDLAMQISKKSPTVVKIDNGFIKKLGSFLGKHKFKRGKKNGRYVWYCKEKPFDYPEI